MTRGLLGALALGALAALPALPATSAPAKPAAAALPGDAEREAWQEQLAEARAAVAQAEGRSAAAEAAVQKMRHRRRPRGDAREALFAERDAARAAHVQAKRALAELLEQARRAGVPPGWLRPEEAAPAAALE